MKSAAVVGLAVAGSAALVGCSTSGNNVEGATNQESMATEGTNMSATAQEPTPVGEVPSSDANASTTSKQASGTYDSSGKTLEQRVQELEDIEAIRNLKYAYWDALDSKDWDRYAEIFTEDCEYDFPAFGSHASGRQEMKDNISSALYPHLKSCHQGQQHFIKITSETTAIGTAHLRDNLINTQTFAEFKGRGYYDEEYKKIDGRWYIHRMSLRYNMTDATYLKKFADQTPPSLGIVF